MNNKNGWGLQSEIIFICVFIFCLISSIILITVLGLYKKNNVNGNTDIVISSVYKNMLNDLEKGAKKYIKNDMDDIVKKSIIINSKVLESKGYINKLVDDNNKACEGYVEVTNDMFLKYNPYVKCKDFISNGYNNNVE
ncbi:MAG: hypothetical protein RR228_00490 [Bacilli bacterium]